MAAKKFVDWAEDNGVDIGNPIFIKCWSAAIKFAEENFSSHNNARDVICPFTQEPCPYAKIDFVCKYNGNCYHAERGKRAPVA